MMGCSIDPFHYRQRHFLLLFYEIPPYKNRERWYQGLTYGSTPAWWIQLQVDSHTRSLQQITCTKINATLQFSQKSGKRKERSRNIVNIVLTVPRQTTEGFSHSPAAAQTDTFPSPTL